MQNDIPKANLPARAPLSFIGDDEKLAEALKIGSPGARKELFERYVDHVRRVLYRVLGTHTDIHELAQEVFLQAFGSVHGLRDNAKLKAWLTRLTVYSAISHIRSLKRNRWLEFQDPTILESTPNQDSDEEDRQALRQVFVILDKMPVNERVPFTLRFIEGLQLSELADACDISVATVKRRLAKAEKRFVLLAKKYPILKQWIESGKRWRNR